MSAVLYVGKTLHERFCPVRRSFGYRLFWVGLHLPSSGDPLSGSRLLGIDRPGLLSIKTRDEAGATARNQVEKLLASEAIDTSEMQIVLMTMPRVCGYVFNPVNFYVCSSGDDVVALVCEVRNTFGEVHHYVASAMERSGDWVAFEFPKQFYVSPFLSDGGMYKLKLLSTGTRYEVSISLMQSGELVFHADLRGNGVPMTTGRLFAVLLYMPLSITLVMARIHWQALLLRLRAGIRPRQKPVPEHPRTIPAPRLSVWHTIRRKLISLATRQSSSKEAS